MKMLFTCYNKGLNPQQGSQILISQIKVEFFEVLNLQQLEGVRCCRGVLRPAITHLDPQD